MKRCYYISNSYDGAYFVLTDNVEDFAQRMSMYMVNLKRSGKCNHYSFGSLEMSEAEYLEAKKGAETLEKERIQARVSMKDKQEKPQERSSSPSLRLV